MRSMWKDGCQTPRLASASSWARTGRTSTIHTLCHPEKKTLSRSRIHGRTILLRFLGIIKRVLRQQLQSGFMQRLGFYNRISSFSCFFLKKPIFIYFVFWFNTTPPLQSGPPWHLSIGLPRPQGELLCPQGPGWASITSRMSHYHPWVSFYAPRTQDEPLSSLGASVPPGPRMSLYNLQDEPLSSLGELLCPQDPGWDSITSNMSHYHPRVSFFAPLDPGWASVSTRMSHYHARVSFFASRAQDEPL